MGKHESTYTFDDFRKAANNSMVSILQNHSIGPHTLRSMIFNHKEQKWFLDGLEELNVRTVIKCIHEGNLTIKYIFPFIDVERFFLQGQFIFELSSHNILTTLLRYYQKAIEHPRLLSLDLAKMLLTKHGVNYYNSSVQKIKEDAAPYLESSINLLYSYLMFTFEDYREGFLDIGKLAIFRTIHPAIIVDVEKFFIYHKKMLPYKWNDNIILPMNDIFYLKSHGVIAEGNIFVQGYPMLLITSFIQSIMNEQFWRNGNVKPEDIPDAWFVDVVRNIPKMNGRTSNKLRHHIDKSPFIVGIPKKVISDAEEKRIACHRLYRQRYDGGGLDDNQYSRNITEKIVTQENRKLAIVRGIRMSIMWTWDELISYLLLSEPDKNVQRFLQSDNQTKRRLLHDI